MSSPAVAGHPWSPRTAASAARRHIYALAVRLASPIPGRYWLVLSGVYAIGYLYWHRYGKPWTGDSLYYTAMAFRYSGHGLEESIQLTGQYFHDPNIDRLHYGFEDPVVSPLIYPRVVYPALSVPFVLVMGGSGIWAVPLLSSIFVVWGLMRLLSRLFNKEIALAVVSIFMLTAAFLEFGTGAFTEAPTMAFVVGILLMLPLKGRPFGAKEAVACSVLIVLITFCRQSDPIVVSAVCGAWVWVTLARRSVRDNPWTLPVAVLLPVGVVCTLLLQWWAPYDAVRWFVRVNSEPNARAAFAHFPQIAWKLVMKDGSTYFSHDLGMLAIWCAGLISCLVRPLSVRTGLVIGALVPSIVLATLNGRPTSFRYYMPMYPFLIVAAAGLLHAVLIRPSTRRPRHSAVDAQRHSDLART